MTEERKFQPRRLLGRIVRFFSYVGVIAVAALIVAHFTWKYSGSAQWELEIDRKGVKVYSLKKPGESLKQFRAVTRVKTTLNRAVAAMTSTDSEDCAEWAATCRSVKAIQAWDTQDMSYIHLFRLDYPKPFQPREFLLKAKVTQDPQTKAVAVDFAADPDKAPRNECCIRVEKMNNRWLFTPLENGEVEVELRTNMDAGVPYFIVNRITPRLFYSMFRPLEKWYNRDKWQHARYALISEK